MSADHLESVNQNSFDSIDSLSVLVVRVDLWTFSSLKKKKKKIPNDNFCFQSEI